MTRVEILRRTRTRNAQAAPRRGPRTLVEKVPSMNLNRIKFTVHSSHRMLQRNVNRSTVERLMRSLPVDEVIVDHEGSQERRYVLQDRNFRVVVPALQPETIVTVIDLRKNNHDDACTIPLNGKDFKAWHLCMKRLRRYMFPRQDVVFTNAHTNFSCVVRKPYTNKLNNGHEIFDMATANPMFRIGLKDFKFEFESQSKKLSIDDFKALSTRQILVNAYETYQNVNITVW